MSRRPSMTIYERSAHEKGFKQVAGIDEAGRGPLAGPVVAAACIIPHGVVIREIDDSKKLNPEQREYFYQKITQDPRFTYAVAVVSHTVIDAINIFQATMRAMLEAVAQLKTEPDLLLVDGLKLPHPHIPTEKIIGGDGLSQSIAAASILAKVTRDAIMRQYHEEYPQYGFDRHKGYSTEVHLDAIAQHGICPIHRRSFEPCKELTCSQLTFL